LLGRGALAPREGRHAAPIRLGKRIFGVIVPTLLGGATPFALRASQVARHHGRRSDPACGAAGSRPRSHRSARRQPRDAQ
jgi:hypothetical protein